MLTRSSGQGRAWWTLGCVGVILWLPQAVWAGDPPRKMAVLPVQVDKSAEGQVPDLFDDVVLTAVQDATGDEVIGSDDINALIGFEEKKDLLGCDDASCLADIGGALGVDRLAVFKIARVGPEWVVTSKIMNIRNAQVELRSSDFVGGDIKALIQAMPQVVRRLFSGGGTGSVPAPPAAAVPSTPLPPPADSPAIEIGSLTISTAPDGVTCSIGSKTFGNTPCHAPDLPVGRYDVDLRKDYYHPRTVVVYVYKGVDTKQSYDLTPIPVKVDVKTKPEGAQLYLNGDEVIARPLVLKPGQYELIAQLTDHEDMVKELDVRPGPGLTLDLALQPGRSGAQQASWNQRLAWGIVFAVAAAGAGGVWGWSGMEALSTRDRLVSSPPGDPNRAQMLSWGTTTATVADGAIIATGVSAAIASALLISLGF